MLPPVNEDPIARLLCHYFQVAELMQENMMKLDRERAKAGRLSKRKSLDRHYYWKLWTAMIHVVVEGLDDLAVERRLQAQGEQFEECKEHLAEIRSTHARHYSELKRFRNAVFHPQMTPSKELEYIRSGADSSGWLRDIYGLLERFFSSYRVAAAVEYAIRGDNQELRRMVWGFDGQSPSERRAGRRTSTNPTT